MSVRANHPSPGEPLPEGPAPLVRTIFLGALGVVVVDQLTKVWAIWALSDRRPVLILGDLLSLRLTYNPGAAFSIGSDNTWIFTLATTIAIVAIGVIARRVRSRAWAAALGLLLGGATTHLLDRLFREPGIGRGHVVDFIDYAGFFVGNVADISLVCGAAIWALLALRGIGLDGRRLPK